MNYKNTLTIIGEDEEVVSVRKSIRSKTNFGELPKYIDFNNIIEMPIGLNLEYNTESDIARQLLFGESFYYEGYSRKQAWQEIATFTRKDQNKSILSAIQIQENIRNTGHAFSHVWKRENWGTERNAYSQVIESPNVISFYTDNAPATKVVDALKLKFPTVSFDHKIEEDDEAGDDLPF
ncbi:hypothetical protein [Maribellus sediminis]|uniref:hypothetical protein n=1 Tax=Maribellus sediminis TaxID=2696285 RepID=UPI00142F5E45|nr:hypothetical protein [Maribellus sediminis]